jgi:S-adenosylmethionine:tRNA ribosyltransferase-isomerase
MTLNRRTGERRHLLVSDLPAVLPEGGLLVFNDSRVRKARLSGETPGGKNVEFLLVDENQGVWRTLCKNASRRRLGGLYNFPGGVTGEITAKSDGVVTLRFDPPVNDSYLDVYGRVPLPPYIKRGEGEAFAARDCERYQTVYAREPGSAAAPTAGLHFTNELLLQLKRQGVECAFITLHVGPGTFLPVRSKTVEGHRMHEESFFIDEKTASRIELAKTQKRKIIAVGTTSARTLESAWSSGGIRAGAGKTSIFIYGAYRFCVVDGLFTNFHTPFSTLLMLVSCFAGQDSSPEEGRRLILDAYALAVEKGYRFFSYGDAMLIE